MEEIKKFVLGQYFTKEEIVKRVINLLQSYKYYSKDVSILEPSAGTRNFVKELVKSGFNKINECEIDKDLTNNPQDFFNFEEKSKFDLVIGNPPFTKYNVKNSYFYPSKYQNISFLENGLNKKEKIQIEKAFILKSIKHLKNKESSIAFVLPISFFIGNKNNETKKILLDNFSTIIIYQNDKSWFEEPIPCCFAIFTNIEEYKDKIILLYEDGEKIKEVIDIGKLLTEELIPKSFLYKKKNGNGKGKHTLSKYLSEKIAKYQRDYKNNNISGANILTKTKIPKEKNIKEYSLAVVRVGNSSIGKTGLINIKENILNDMFYVFDFKEEHNLNKELKEKIVSEINKNQEHFRNLSVRVGSKSMKKNDLLNFKINL
ncbi:MAG: SAM-dependent methyltransferase [Bacteroidetes bacterium]|nr:SAM-dependent methyltransferase [Bacteroidota bacterium]